MTGKAEVKRKKFGDLTQRRGDAEKKEDSEH
jgi:hypothetical protein